MTTTPTNNASSATRAQRLRTHTGARYILAGVVLTVVALLHLAGVFSNGFDLSGNQLVKLGIAAIGIVMIITGTVKSVRR